MGLSYTLVSKEKKKFEGKWVYPIYLKYSFGGKQKLISTSQIGAKEIGIRKKNISTHSLRKSGARFIWEEFNKSDESLIKLSMVLNHSSSAITRRYLGITKEEIADIYEGFNFNL